MKCSEWISGMIGQNGFGHMNGSSGKNKVWHYVIFWLSKRDSFGGLTPVRLSLSVLFVNKTARKVSRVLFSLLFGIAKIL